MSLLLRFLLCMLLLNSSSCTTQQDRDRATTIAQCKISCSEQLDYCRELCLNNCPNCSAHAEYSTAKHYRKYLCQEEIQGGVIMRELNSYRDPLQCRKVTCNCSADYNICIQSCTGVIQKQLRALPYCT